MSKNKQEKTEIKRPVEVRTPPNYLLDDAPRSPEYIKACSKYVLVLETDGFGVIPHN